FNAIREGMARMAGESTKWSEVETSSFQAMRENLLEAAQALGEDVSAAAQYADALEKSHAAHAKNMDYVKSFESMASSFETLATSAQLDVQGAKTATEQAAAEAAAAAFEGGTGADIVNQFQAGFENLRGAHDTAAMNYVAGLL